jgi:hypothetical protein
MQSRTFPRRHGPDGALTECEHHDAGHVANLFSIQRATVVKLSIHGPWPHAAPPTAGRPAPWFCTHDIGRITDLIARDAGGGDEA